MSVICLPCISFLYIYCIIYQPDVTKASDDQNGCILSSLKRKFCVICVDKECISGLTIISYDLFISHKATEFALGECWLQI